jgi:hypothetical protein
MLRSLKRKQILPSIKAEALRDAGPVLEYAARRCKRNREPEALSRGVLLEFNHIRPTK